MSAALGDIVLDNGLSVLDTVSTHIVICGTEPTALSECSVDGNTAGAANALGWKSFGAGGCFGPPAAGSPNGRVVTSATVTDGTILTSGSANYWAAIDGTTSMHAHGALSGGQSVSSGNVWTLSEFTIRIPASA